MLKHCFYIFIFLASANSGYTQETQLSAVGIDSLSCIRGIIIQGNHCTKKEIIHHFLEFDTGTVVDSVKLRSAKERLLKSDLFVKVDIFSLQKQNGIYVYVYLVEYPYLTISDIGGDYYLRKYGDPQFWWRLHFGIEHQNFRGKMEIFRAQLSFWDYRSFGISWYKPLYPSKYYMGVGAGIDQHPEEKKWYDHSAASAKVYVGRTFRQNLRVNLGMNPYYDREITRIPTLDSLNTNAIRRKEKYYLIDTVRIFEVFSNINFYMDFRTSSFDPKSGFSYFSECKTNGLYTNKVPTYVQFYNDIRCYIPSLYNSKFVVRLSTMFRNEYTGDFHSMQLGGVGTIRGFSNGDLPNKNINAKDLGLFSAEYRFRIFQFPTMKVPILSDYSDALKALVYRLDGAIFMDYGRIAPSLRELFDYNSRFIESGTGLGAGLRLMVPTLKKSGSIDVAWRSDPSSHRGKVRFLSQPVFYLYVDMLN